MNYPPFNHIFWHDLSFCCLQECFIIFTHPERWFYNLKNLIFFEILNSVNWVVKFKVSLLDFIRMRWNFAQTNRTKLELLKYRKKVIDFLRWNSMRNSVMHNLLYVFYLRNLDIDFRFQMVLCFHVWILWFWLNPFVWFHPRLNLLKLFSENVQFFLWVTALIKLWNKFTNNNEKSWLSIIYVLISRKRMNYFNYALPN